MRLNSIEKTLMNNPLRAVLQRRFEARILERLGGRMRGGLALEIGCGCGVGVRIIREVFGAEVVHAFDLDPQMVALARQAVGKRTTRTVFWVGNTLTIPVRDNSYNAVFDFGTIHHVIDWRKALSEVHRVLKPGGRFYVEEILEKYIVHPLFRRLLAHPQQDRFNQAGFAGELQRQGFRLINTDSFMQLFGWFIADKPAAAIDSIG